jgi:transposase-like protein
MSAEDLGRVLCLNRKTAQKLNRMMRHLTTDLHPRTLPGVSEWDESMFSKQWVLGGVSRETRQCFLQIVPNRTEETLTPLVEKHSDPEGLIFTDEWGGYINLVRHMTVCHAREFVNSQARFVHTNTQEGIWGHAKALSWHTYRGIPKPSLPQFLSEIMFRYNMRNYKTRFAVLSALLSRKTNSLLS